MSRPASQSVGATAVRRARTHSLCADAVDASDAAPVAYALRARKRARLAPPPDPPPLLNGTNASRISASRPLSYALPRERRRLEHLPQHAPVPVSASAAAPAQVPVARTPSQPPHIAPLRKPLPPYCLPNRDDADGHIIYKLGDGLLPSAKLPNGRYKILSDLGEGTFGKVVECWDRSRCQRVAVKIIRNVTKYRQAARLEIDVLVHIKMHDPRQLYHCVKFYTWFDYQSHICIVFEKLGPSLYEQLRRNRFRPFPLQQVRAFAFQLLQSVNFVHNLTLIHTDLKPENILLADPKRPNDIKLIDFGSATFEAQHHSAVISTRHYRAPEVILGLGWTYPCDLWSIGCILVELYTGRALFQTHENLEHLAMMMTLLGPIPDSVIRRADCSGQKYFTRLKGGRMALNWPQGASSRESVRSVNKVQALHKIIRDQDAHATFFDLVRRLLDFEPKTRCTSAEALQHPFFQDDVLGAPQNASSSAASTPLQRSSANSSTKWKRRSVKRKHAQNVSTISSNASSSSSVGAADALVLYQDEDVHQGS